MKSFAAVAAAVLAVAILLMAPVSETDAVYSNISGDAVIGTSASEEYVITYNNTDYSDKTDVSVAVSYSAKFVDSKGETVSSGVSPSSGSMDNGGSATLTVKAPSNTGDYRLIVTYDVDVTYTDDEGKTVEVPEADLAREDTYSIKVVTPVVLSVTLTNDSDVDLSSYGVYFAMLESGSWVTLDDSYKTVDLAKAGTATVSYNWVADPSDGKYTFKVIPADSGNLITITGIDEEHVFYIGDNDYSIWIWILVLFVVIMALVMVWVYRKPVKNYGKPKSRR